VIELWIIKSLCVFSVTLILTKSVIMACKRDFVEKRFEAAKINGYPNLLHQIWHAIWHCPMCSGFWVSLCFAANNTCFGLIYDVLSMFGANWLLHCLEEYLFNKREK